MTVALALNGISVPVADGSAKVKPDIIGDTVRAVDGSLVRDWRTTKLTWELEMVLSSGSDANAFRDLLLGKHDNWSLEAASLYSAKGYPLTLSGGSVATNAQQKFGSYSVSAPNAASGCVKIGDGATGYDYSTRPWSVCWWQRGASSWFPYVMRSDGSNWAGGTPTGAITYWASSAYQLAYTQANGFTCYLDDITVFPFLVPSTWPALLAAATLPWSTSPSLRATGLLIEDNAAAGVTVSGEIDDSTFMQAFLSPGTLSPGAQKLGFRLVEV